jgi:hypothetical protein
MRTVLAALVGLAIGAVLAWALGVFVLHWHWETTLLAIELAAVGFAVLAVLLVHRRKKLRSA